MKTAADLVDAGAAVARLMKYLDVPGITGQEAAIAAAVRADLIDLGVPAEAIRFDDANRRIPVPTETGNLIVQLPGTVPGPRLLFSTHLDTVPLCAGAKPRREGDRIESDGTTALGGDNRTGCAVLVTLVETLLKHRLQYPPLTLLFTVREESGLYGARHLNPADLGGVAMGFNVDGKLAHEMTVAAVGAERWEVEILGKAAHAGVAPEKGISATLVLALALAEVHRGGWFGKVVQGDRAGTSNVGPVAGRTGGSAGDATNVVTDYVHVKGESRSHDAAFAAEITQAYRTAFENAAKAVTDDQGSTAQVKFDGRQDYAAFKLADDEPVVRHAFRAAEAMGLTPKTKVANGGLDANWFVRHGIPTVTIGAGQYEIHTVAEYVDVPEFERGCRLAVALATV